MKSDGVKWAVLAIALAAGTIYAAGGPDNAWKKASTSASKYGSQLKSDTSGSIRPATQAGNSGAQKGGPPAAAAVTVSKPLKRQITEWDEYTGRFDNVQAVDIRTRVSGYLTEVHFTDGQIVKKGDLLFSIDPRPFERALDQAKAEFDQATTKAQNTNLDVDRGRPLVDRKIISEKVFDDRTNLLREAQAAVRVTEAKVKTAELDLVFTKITAPIAGRVSRANASTGSWVSAGAVANATLLTNIVAENPIHLYFDISESNWLKYRRMLDKSEVKGTATSAALLGTPIELAMPDEQGYPHKARIDFVDNRLDPATATMRGRAIVDNADGLFSAGMFARLRVRGSPPYEAILIPDAAISSDQTNKFALAVDAEGKVTRKALELGPIIDGLRVIRAGLTADDVIITKGLQRARPGGTVTPKMEPLRVSETNAAKAAPEQPASEKPKTEKSKTEKPASEKRASEMPAASK